MRSIALFLPNWVGDVVMATPAVRAVRRRFPRARIVGVGKPYVADTLTGCPWLDDQIPFDKRRPFELVRRLRAERIEAAVLFPNSFRPALMARLAGANRVVGFARYFRDPLLSTRFYPTRDISGRPKPTPVLDDYNRLAVAIGTSDPGHRTELFTTSADEVAADAVWRTLGLHRFPSIIGLNPGGAFGAAKHWPEEHFIEVARRFAARGFGVLTVCGPAERDAARRIAVGSGTLSLADSPLSLGLTKAVVRRLRLLVTTDSGPRHFAPAFGVPVVTLFGPTHVAWTETYFPHAVHLQMKLPCGPCQRRVCPLGHHRCMTDLTPAAVFAAADALLTRTPEGHAHAG